MNFKSNFVKQNTKNEVKNLNFRSSFFRNMCFERTGRRWPYKSIAREACGKLVKLSYKFKSNEAQVATVKINFKKIDRRLKRVELSSHYNIVRTARL